MLKMAIVASIGLCIASVCQNSAVPTQGNTANASQALTPQQKERLRTMDQEQAAFRSGGFRAAAAVNGHFVASTETHTWMGYSLPQLVQASHLIVLGTADSNHCSITRDGQKIVTEYRIQVNQVYKGKASAGQTIIVALPGGKVEFEDGTTAELITPHFRKMENGRQYVLFLEERHPLGGEGYTLTGLQQGLFSFSPDGSTVVSHALPVDSIYKETNNEGAPLFLKILRELTASR